MLCTWPMLLKTIINRGGSKMFKDIINRALVCLIAIFIIVGGYSYYNWSKRDTLIVGDYYDLIIGHMLMGPIRHNYNNHTSIKIFDLANQQIMIKHDTQTNKLYLGVSVKVEEDKATFRMYELVKAIGDLGIYKSTI